MEEPRGLPAVPASAETANAETIAATGKKRPTHKVPETIGHFRILECIGEGGMGIVYRAEQRHPVRRMVALKVIKVGMDTDDVVARFEAERQALALMSHPSVAKVFEAGVTETGRPYFAMEYVPGLPLTEYCAAEKLSTRLRMELFIPICNAVQHAHQKGIIHRDLKPSNILVTMFEGKPVPKVIDFGIAKATNQALTQHTLFTQTGALVGTPEYMSPEQAITSGLDVDTRTDIYSLGVILYELLTGSLPFDPKTLRQAGLEGMARIIKENEPPKPSLRVMFTATEPAEPRGSRRASTHRSGDTRTLERELRGDLDWITLKAMEKDRTRRYETANGLAADLQRYLKNEPVLAGPPTATYRLKKFARRHHAALLVGTLTLVALLFGLGAATYGLLSARHQRDLARTAEWNAANDRGAAIRARNDAMGKLYDASLSQARAWRFAGRAGRRFDSLKALSVAATIRPTLELRNEAIACMTLADLRQSRRWEPTPGEPYPRAFDVQFARYARSDAKGGITVCRIGDDRELIQLPGPGKPVAWVLRFSPDGRFLAATYGDPPQEFCLWDLSTRAPALKLGSEITPEGIDFSRDGRLLGVGKNDSTVTFYELPSARQMNILKVRLPPRSLRIQPQGERIALTCHTGDIEIRDRATGDFIRMFHSFGLTHGIAWHPDGRHLASAGADSRAYVWDTDTGAVTATMIGHQSDVIRVAFNQGGDLLASGGWDGALRLWDSTTGKQLVSVEGSETFIQFSPDDEKLVCGGTGATLWDLSVAPEYRVLHGHVGGKAPISAGFSADGRWVATAGYDGVQLWDSRSGHELAFLPSGWTRTIHFPADATSLLTSGGAEILQWPIQFSTETGRRIQLGPARVWGHAIGEASFTADSRDAVAVEEGFSLGRINADSPNKLLILGLQPAIDHVAISPDGHWAATAAPGPAQVKVWDLQVPGTKQDLPISVRGAFPVFTPDSRQLVIAAPDDYSFWEVGSWRLTHRIGRGGNRLPGRMAFSPEGKMMAIAYSNFLVRLVDPADGREIATLEAPETPLISWITFSPDGARLAVATENHLTQLWDLRRIRRTLAAMGLDWTAEPLADPRPGSETPPTESELVSVSMAPLDTSAAPTIEWSKPDDLSSVRNRADFYARHGRFREATIDYHKAVEIEAGDGWHWYLCVLTDLFLEDQNSYRKDSAEMLKRFSRTTVPELAERTAKVCLLSPDAVDDGIASALLERAATLPSLRPWYELAKGIGEYRGARFDAALSHLEKARSLPIPPSRATVEYFIAMAHHGLGESEKAAAALKQANVFMRLVPDSDRDDLGTYGVDNWLICQIAQREALRVVSSEIAK